MNQVVQILSDYAIWIGVAGVISLLVLIGFMFDSKRNKNKKEDPQEELGEPDVVITSDTVNILNSALPAVGPDMVQAVTTEAAVMAAPAVENNMPDLSAVASVAVDPVVEPVTEVTVTAEESLVVDPVVEPVVEETLEQPIVEETMPAAEPVVENNMPDLSAFAYTAPEPAVEEAVIAEVAPAAQTPDLSAFAYTAPEPAVETAEEASPVAETPDLSAFAYTAPETAVEPVAEQLVVEEAVVVEPVVTESKPTQINL